MPNKVKKTKIASNIITPNDVASAITRLKINKNAANTTYVTKFNIDGQPEEKLNKQLSDEQCCATKIVSGRKISYKIKTQRGGRLYDPSKDSNTYGLNKRDRTTNEAMFILRDATPQAFDAYIKYLQTRYETYLISAERAI